MDAFGIWLLPFLELPPQWGRPMVLFRLVQWETKTGFTKQQRLKLPPLVMVLALKHRQTTLFMAGLLSKIVLCA